MVQKLGPKGLEFGRYSIEYHILRNYLFVSRHMGPERAARHMPENAKRIVAAYDKDGAISKRCALLSHVSKLSFPYYLDTCPRTPSESWLSTIKTVPSPQGMLSCLMPELTSVLRGLPYEQLLSESV